MKSNEKKSLIFKILIFIGSIILLALILEALDVVNFERAEPLLSPESLPVCNAGGMTDALDCSFDSYSCPYAKGTMGPYPAGHFCYPDYSGGGGCGSGGCDIANMAHDPNLCKTACSVSGDGQQNCYECNWDASNEVCTQGAQCKPQGSLMCWPNLRRCGTEADGNNGHALRMLCSGSWTVEDNCALEYNMGVCVEDSGNPPITMPSTECVECDKDGDGYAPAGKPYPCPQCSGIDCDCNDEDSSIHPGIEKRCHDTIDNDCDGFIDKGGVPGFAADSDCDMPCEEPDTTLTTCQDLDDWDNKNPSDIGGELGIKCSTYVNGYQNADSCWTAYEFGMSGISNIKYIFEVWEADCADSAHSTRNKRNCPSEAACFMDRCVPIMKLHNWTNNFDSSKPTIIFINGQWSSYRAFLSFYESYNQDYNLFYFQPNDNAGDFAVAEKLNSEIKTLIQERSPKYPVYFITHSRGYNRLRAAVISATDASVIDFYKNSIVFAVSPVPGGSAPANQNTLSAIATWAPPFPAFWLPPVADIVDTVNELNPRGSYQEKLYGDSASAKFRSSVKDYYTFTVRGDNHLAGIWLYMKGKIGLLSGWLNEWHRHYKNGVGIDSLHHFEYYTSKDNAWVSVDSSDVLARHIAEVGPVREMWKSVYGPKATQDEWKEFDIVLKSSGGVEHSLLLYYYPLVSQIKSVIGSSGISGITGLAISGEESGVLPDAVIADSCEVERTRVGNCLTSGECASICAISGDPAACVLLCNDEEQFCREIFELDLEYCNELYALNGTVHDFDGDGKADILWRETATGKTVVWMMNGSIKTASAYTSASAGTGWIVSGVADFTGDRKADILWRELSSGKTVVWTMNGATKTASAYTSAFAGTGWDVAGVADFNGDKKADILWRETATGKTVVWMMNGSIKTASAYTSASAGTGWIVAGVADFNGDKKADILWRETATGKTVVWMMNGSIKTSSAYTSASAGTGWAVSGVADFTGDGKSDILWRETATGKTVVWVMDGANKTTSAYTSASAGTGWIVSGVADFNGDKKADILWRETATGKTVIWAMDGATKIASAYTSASAGTGWAVQ